MKKLLDILLNPQKRVPMDTLIKCEQVLERMDMLKTKSVSQTHWSVEQVIFVMKGLVK